MGQAEKSALLRRSFGCRKYEWSPNLDDILAAQLPIKEKEVLARVIEPIFYCTQYKANGLVKPKYLFWGYGGKENGRRMWQRAGREHMWLCVRGCRSGRRDMKSRTESKRQSHLCKVTRQLWPGRKGRRHE